MDSALGKYMEGDPSIRPDHVTLLMDGITPLQSTVQGISALILRALQIHGNPFCIRRYPQM